VNNRDGQAGEARLRAMVLAAGLGTRLRPLTNDRPKALVEVAGRTMLEITLCRLRAFGIHDVIVNVHHFADLAIDYLHAKNNFGMRIEISHEEILLDTGGGLKKAAPFFLEAENNGEPFLLHNVDILSSFDFEKLIAIHKQNRALATLAVQKRKTSRLLLFDDQMELRGRQSITEQTPPYEEALAFSGIHIISPRLIGMMTEEGAFSIIDTYLRLSKEGEKIIGYRDDSAYWSDLGKPESVAQAQRDIYLSPTLAP
jgi:NDP-sugar pyrophosphorylase family protein